MSEVKVDTISERTAAGGVTIDGVLVKDGVATFQTAAGSPLVFEGATADAFETTFAITDPTADRTITFPDESITLSAGGGLLGLVVYTGDGTYTVGGTSNGTAGDEGNASVTKVIIESQAAGGGAANNGGSGGVYNGGSGGGGAYSKTFRSVTTSDAITIVVPSGGAGGAPGVAGGTASLTKSSGSGTFATITCLGGSGGLSPVSTTQGSGGNGAAAPTTGDINIAGGYGVGGNAGGMAAAGGSFMGVSTRIHLPPGGVGPAPVGYGNGGCAGSGNSGGAGGAGLILIWEYA